MKVTLYRKDMTFLKTFETPENHMVIHTYDFSSKIKSDDSFQNNDFYEAAFIEKKRNSSQPFQGMKFMQTKTDI